MGHCKSKMLNGKNISPMSRAAVLTIAKSWKQPKCPSVDEWVKMSYIYLAVKSKEILPFATAWMDLENIKLSDISPSEKDKCPLISLVCGI